VLRVGPPPGRYRRTVSAPAAPCWLVRDTEVLAAVEVPAGARGRARGLLGRDHVDGVMLLRPCRNVHTFRMRFPIDVAFCDRDDVVLRTVTLRPGRVSPVVWRSKYVLEAEAGAFARWSVRAGDRLELRP
jgi:uncharacterized protein